MYSFIQYTQKDVGRRLYKENGDLQYFSDRFPQHILLTEAEPTCCLLHQSLLGACCQKCQLCCMHFVQMEIPGFF